MPKQVTTDHGLIIHFAGRHHLFPVASAQDAKEVRLATREDLREDEVRVGWPAWFRPFIDGRLVFLYDETSGQAVTRAEADEQLRASATPDAAKAP
jgi:hypothetical protein